MKRLSLQRRLLVIALVLVKLALGVLLPGPLQAHDMACSEHDMAMSMDMSAAMSADMSMDMSTPAEHAHQHSAPHAPCCKSGNCPCLQTPTLCAVVPQMSLATPPSLLIATRSAPFTVPGTSSFFRPPI